MSADGGDFLAELRKRFLLRAAEDLSALSTGAGDPAELDARVHRLSGSAGVFGFAEVSAAAGVIDDARAAGKEPSPADFQALISALERLPRPA